MRASICGVLVSVLLLGRRNDSCLGTLKHFALENRLVLPRSNVPFEREFSLRAGSPSHAADAARRTRHSFPVRPRNQ